MIIEKPYFMANEEWFYFSQDEFRYKLTDKATAEAKRSYEEFYSLFDELGSGADEETIRY